jgi:hypothetical protein
MTPTLSRSVLYIEQGGTSGFIASGKRVALPELDIRKGILGYSVFAYVGEDGLFEYHCLVTGCDGVIVQGKIDAPPSSTLSPFGDHLLLPFALTR